MYNSFNTKHGLNVRDGGGNNAKLSDEQKQKISNSLKGKKHSAERIEKNRLGQLNKASSIAKRLRESLYPKIKKSRLGTKHSEETKEKLRNLVLGEKNPNYGKKRSEESKQKTRESVTKYWLNKKLCQK